MIPEFMLLVLIAAFAAEIGWLCRVRHIRKLLKRRSQFSSQLGHSVENAHHITYSLFAFGLRYGRVHLAAQQEIDEGIEIAGNHACDASKLGEHVGNAFLAVWWVLDEFASALALSCRNRFGGKRVYFLLWR